MARGSYTRITRAGLLVGVLFTCSSCVYVHTGDMARSRYEREVPLAAPLTAGSSFSADTGDGSIRVRGVETSECKVQAKVVAHAGTEERARELAEQIEPRLEPSGNGLKVVIDRPHTLVNAWYSVSLDVQVPTQTSLTLTTGDGSVHVADITGSVEARTGDGSVEVETVKGNVKLHTSDGSVACTRLDAETVDVQTGDGGITLSDVRADNLTARTGDGGIRGRQIAADRADFHTSDGAIHIDWAPDGPQAPNVTATTSSGSITFTAPPELSAVIEASTGDGSIHTNLPITVEGKVGGKSLTGTVGGGEGRIGLRTHDGSITIR